MIQDADREKRAKTRVAEAAAATGLMSGGVKTGTVKTGTVRTGGLAAKARAAAEPSGLLGQLGFRPVEGAPNEIGTVTQDGPFILDRMDPAALKSAPIRPEWILDGTPEAKCARVAALSDHRGDICHWSCTAGRFRWHYGWDEAVMFLEGRVEITADSGHVYIGEPGVSLFFPAGTTAVWHVPHYIRKVAFNHNPVPRSLHRLTRIMDKARAVLERARGKSAAAALLG